MIYVAVSSVFPFFAVTSRAWEEISDGGGLMVVAFVIAVGIVIGYGLRSLVGRWKADSIERRMALRNDETEAEIAARLKEMDVKSRAAVVAAREDFEKSMKGRRDELEQQTARVATREANLDRKATLLDQREATLDKKAAAVDAAAQAARTAAVDAEDKMRAAESRLHALAKMTGEEARKEVLARADEALREDAGTLARRLQEAARIEADEKARNIVSDAIQRCAAACVVELTTTNVTLASDEIKGRIVGKDGRNLRAFEQATGVSLLLDEAPETVVLSSFDPLRREIAHRALTALLASGRIHPQAVEDAVAKAREEVDAVALEAGEAAAAEAGVAGLSTEVLRMMGMLAFRTSFTQNALRHSVEVSLLASVLAAELGLDAARAARIGFLHDVGKALPSEQKGPHAQLGADWLRARGEDETTCRAIAAHHPEAKVDGGTWGVLCAAADAISAARPGARRENVEGYLRRLTDVEAVAKAHKGVKQAFAVQAGRDLRIIVDPAEVSDADAQALARDVCREISTQLSFPGVIRVTVVRELRCIDYAK